MKISDFLKICSFGSLHLICYIENEDYPIWEGEQYHFPYWLADFEIADNKFLEEPIDYRSSLGEDYNNEPGFVICLKDKEE